MPDMTLIPPALPEGFSMDDLDFVVTYNGEVTTNLDLDCTKASLKNVAALKIDEEQGTVRLYPLWQGTYTITAQLKQASQATSSTPKPQRCMWVRCLR